MRFLIFYILVIIYCLASVIKSVDEITSDDFERYKSCVLNYIREYEYLSRRFSLLQLTKACKRYDNWLQTLKLNSNTTAPRNYTNAQKKYLDRIQYCHNFVDCYGDTLPQRKQIGNQTDVRNKRQTGVAVRRECRTLSTPEMETYFDTLNRLKNTFVDGTSKYDLLVQEHLPNVAPEAHFGPAFLPYHRELLKQLEVAGRRENPLFALCYWDSRLDHDLPNPAQSVLWMDNFFGNGNGYVTTGPFANWKTTITVPGADDERLYRQVGRSNSATLYSHRDIDLFLTKTSFENLACYCKDPTFEILHAGVHDFVGGYMTYIPASPNDPTFFNHHCFIDYIWELWRETKQTPEQQTTDYPPDDRACDPQHYANSTMKPFKIQIIDGLSNDYNQLYAYDDPPTCDKGCNGIFLFCNTHTNRCMSKIRPGGRCAGLESYDSCYESICVNGTCSQSASDVSTTGVSISEQQPTAASVTLQTFQPAAVVVTSVGSGHKKTESHRDSTNDSNLNSNDTNSNNDRETI